MDERRKRKMEEGGGSGGEGRRDGETKVEVEDGEWRDGGITKNSMKEK